MFGILAGGLNCVCFAYPRCQFFNSRGCLDGGKHRIDLRLETPTLSLSFSLSNSPVAGVWSILKPQLGHGQVESGATWPSWFELLGRWDFKEKKGETEREWDFKRER